MKRKTTSFVCQECGYDSPQWLGKCPECGMWNTLREISNLKSQISNATGIKQRVEPKRLDQIKFENKQRLLTGFSEFDGVLGGGIVRGSVILLAGDPGIGKSTLLLQVALKMAGGAISPVLYVSGEESEEQIKLRADRINPSASSGSKDKSNFLVLSVTNTDLAVELIQKSKPSLVIIDSIQTMESENVTGLSGSV